MELMPGTCITSFYPYNNLWSHFFYHPYFTEENLKVCSQEVKDSRFEPKPLDSRAYAFSHYYEDKNDDSTSEYHKYIFEKKP